MHKRDAEAYWRLRLEGLEREPQAFGESAEEHRAAGLERAAGRLRATSRGGSFMLGAFADSQLVGVASLLRNQGAKSRHKGLIVGVYVKEGWRAKGVGRALLTKLLDIARSQPGLEQVTLTVGAGQAAAKQLYLSLGFEVYGYERRALKIGERYVDEELMVLPLKPS